MREPTPDISREPLAPREPFPVTCSLLSPEALRAEVAGAYAFGEVAECRLLRSEEIGMLRRWGDGGHLTTAE